MEKRIEELEAEQKTVEDAIFTLNREMGMVLGELKWIRIFVTGTAIAAIGQLLLTLFGG